MLRYEKNLSEFIRFHELEGKQAIAVTLAFKLASSIYEKELEKYHWLLDNVEEKDINPNDDLDERTEYVFPRLIAYTPYCGNISIEETIESRMKLK